MPDAAIKNWIPYKLVKTRNGWRFRWLNTFGAPFGEPFFSQTILKCRGLAGGQRLLPSVSEPEMVKEWSKDIQSVEPTAFIFHISRCGSTLVSQLLGTLKEHIVLSEVPVFDEILGLAFNDPQIVPREIGALFTAALKFYGQPKTESEKRLFVKTDSWHIFYYDQIRRLYPTVPFIFIYRNPVEVFASLIKRPGMQAVPGLISPAVFGFSPDEITYDRQDIYITRVLERYLQYYLEIADADRQCLFLDYADGVMPMLEKIAGFTGTILTEQELALARERSRYHAKNPAEQFRGETPVNIPELLNNATSLYDKLKGMRRD